MEKLKVILVGVSFSLVIFLVATKVRELSMLELTPVSNTEVNYIPDFNFKTLTGKSYTSVELPNGKPIVLMYFDPSCEDCKQIMEKILKYYVEFENVHLLLVTEADPSTAQEFSKQYRLDTFKNVSVLIDHQEIMFKKFNLVEYPSFVIFDTDKNLVKVVDEFVTLPIVVKYVRQAVKEKS